jgi:PPM family protein phosphatase
MNAVISQYIEPGNDELQDRLEIVRLDSRIVFIMADGSGGTRGGGEAADRFVRSARDMATKLLQAEDCRRLIQSLDNEIAKAVDCGETTGIITVVQSDVLFGASVGDSAAALVTSRGVHQVSGGPRKPYLGSGFAIPSQFALRISNGTLVIATDGLWKYTSLESIEQKARTGIPDRLAKELADLVRLRSGALPDDIAIATCRIAP